MPCGLGASFADALGGMLHTLRGPRGVTSFEAVGEPSSDGLPGPEPHALEVPKAPGHQGLSVAAAPRPGRAAARKPQDEAELPALRTRPAGTVPEKQGRRSIICGVSTGEGGADGRIICGIPVRRDKLTGAPYVMPLYVQPPARGSRPSGAAETTDLEAQRMQAAASVRLRQQALELLARFLDVAPAPGGDVAGVYPVPSKAAPAGLELVDTGVVNAGPKGFL